jgi:hypothetical protein
MQEETNAITAEARVLGQTIKPFEYGNTEVSKLGEVLEVKAVGTWGEHHWPVSLHITVPPGCGAIPCTGDSVRVTVERA